jgi:SAM-dependent methyltransferase
VDFWDDPANVEAYINMADGYDGAALITTLRRYLPDGATVLELGMGGGKDLLLLAQHHGVTGSDQSLAFLERFRAAHPDADLLQLDAVALATERRWDAIYSNKVLQHVERDQLADSFARQARLLRPNGIALHSLWYGEGDEVMPGFYSAYYKEDDLRKAVGDAFEVLLLERYSEMEPDDSLVLVLKKRG